MGNDGKQKRSKRKSIFQVVSVAGNGALFTRRFNSLNNANNIKENRNGDKKKDTLRNVSAAAWVQTIRCDVIDFESHAKTKAICQNVVVYLFMCDNLVI